MEKTTLKSLEETNLLRSVGFTGGGLFESELFAPVRALEIGEAVIIGSSDVSGRDWMKMKNGSITYGYAKKRGWKMSHKILTDGRIAIIRNV